MRLIMSWGFSQGEKEAIYTKGGKKEIINKQSCLGEVENEGNRKVL